MEHYFGTATFPRSRAFFCFDWEFALTDSLDRPEDYTPFRPVQLPHDWSVDYPLDEGAPSCGSGGYARCGIGWYRKKFCIHPLPQELYSLYFEGVYMNCDLWVNDHYAGGHVKCGSAGNHTPG